MEAKEVRSLMEAYASVYEGYGKKKKGDCVSKSEKGDHNCAKKVCHEEYGEGETIFGQHAVPDENGFVSHYNVQFEHGIVEDVSVEELDVLTMEAHNEHVEHQEDTISEMGGMMGAIKKVAKKVIGPADQSPKAEAERMNKRRPQTAQEKGVAAGTVNKNESVEVDVDSIEEEKTTNSPMHRPGGKLSPLTSDKKPKSKKSPSPTKMGKPSNPPMKEDLDLFDTIKNYLIDEGLSEEEALKKMLALTDEERSEIIEGTCPSKKKNKKMKGGY